jgi:hypothetical protein
VNGEQVAALTEKLARYYHSEYVRLNRPEILATPYHEWLKRQLIRLEVYENVAS